MKDDQVPEPTDSVDRPFTVIYRIKVRRGRSNEFVAAAFRCAALLKEFKGSHGSLLVDCGDERYVSVSVWPSRRAWLERSRVVIETQEVEAEVAALVEEFVPAGEFGGSLVFQSLGDLS